MLGVVASVCTHPKLSTIRKKKWTDNCSWKKVERSSLCINVFAFRRLIRHCYHTFQIVKFFFSKCYALHNDFYLHDSKVNFDNKSDRSKKRKKEQHSRARFWSSDLWVMGPARFHCATLLRVSLRSFFAAPISKSSQMPVRAKRESWNGRNAGYV